MTDHGDNQVETVERTDPPAADAEQQNQATEAPQGEANANTATPEATDVETLQRELATARQEAAENQDKYLRAHAEMQNFKRRTEQRFADQAKRSKTDLLLKLLAVKDNLERALQYGEEAGAGESLMAGVRLTEYQLDQLLSAEGVRKIEAMDKPFDPHLEEAVQSVNDPNVPDHTVIQVVRQGYTYGDEVLRPAQVVVSVHQS